jgi:hypothetical protein
VPRLARVTDVAEGAESREQMTVWDRVVRQPGRRRSGEPEHADEPDATGNAVQRKIAPLGGMVTRRLVRHATSGPA